MGTKCPKCESTAWEIETEEPRGSNFKLNFIRCATCKTALSVLEYFNAGVLLNQIKEKLGIRD